MDDRLGLRLPVTEWAGEPNSINRIPNHDDHSADSDHSSMTTVFRWMIEADPSSMTTVFRAGAAAPLTRT